MSGLEERVAALEAKVEKMASELDFFLGTALSTAPQRHPDEQDAGLAWGKPALERGAAGAAMPDPHTDAGGAASQDLRLTPQESSASAARRADAAALPIESLCDRLAEVFNLDDTPDELCTEARLAIEAMWQELECCASIFAAMGGSGPAHAGRIRAILGQHHWTKHDIEDRHTAALHRAEADGRRRGIEEAARIAEAVLAHAPVDQDESDAVVESIRALPHDRFCDAVQRGPDLGASTKPCNCEQSPALLRALPARAPGEDEEHA